MRLQLCGCPRCRVSRLPAERGTPRFTIRHLFWLRKVHYNYLNYYTNLGTVVTRYLLSSHGVQQCSNRTIETSPNPSNLANAVSRAPKVRLTISDTNTWG